MGNGLPGHYELKEDMATSIETLDGHTSINCPLRFASPYRA